MRCNHCKRTIAAGVEARKLIAEYTQPDGTTVVFGFQMSAGELSAATGVLVRGWHNRCYHIVRKRAARGDAVTGRVLSGAVPTGYDLAAGAGTAPLSARLAQLQAVATRIGKAVGDPAVTEALRADEHGGPYPHTHPMRLDTYQLRAHLRYGHGSDPDGQSAGLHTVHDEAHARAVLDATRAARAADPGHHPPEESDWRRQLVVDAADLTLDPTPRGK